MKILTLNTSHTNIIGFRKRLKALVDFINQERPELVLLQEGAGGVAALVLYWCWSTFNKLGKKLEGYKWADYCSFYVPWPWLQYRNAVMTPFEIKEQFCIDTPKVSDEGARTATVVESDGAQFVSVHLSSECGDEGKILEIEAIVNSLTCWKAIIGGDFNCVSGSPVWKYLSYRGFEVIGHGIDAVALRGYSHVLSCEKVLPGVSDHPGVLVEI